ncbi:MAG TPA: four helix bundle protein [Bacteroidales bacterium]|nr:four helix bundle protein [Bacteroidales bacterium]
MSDVIQKSENVLLDLTFDFSLEIIKFCDMLEAERKYIIARQLLRSGTSIGANIREAQQPESKADFIHKLKIASKEAEETEYWLALCKHSESYPYKEKLSEKLTVIKKIIFKSIVTAKSNSK